MPNSTAQTPCVRLRHRAAVAVPLAACLALGDLLPGQVPQQAAVPVAAIATASPPSLAFSWPLDATATGYSVARRLPGATSWSAFTSIPGAGAATSWTDTNIAVGTRYEYFFLKSGNPQARGLVTAGIEANALEHRGTLVLLVGRWGPYAARASIAGSPPWAATAGPCCATTSRRRRPCRASRR